MSANLSLFFSSLLLLICLSLLLEYKCRHKTLDIFDFFIGLVILYFGLWGIIDSLILDVSSMSAISIFLSYMIVVLPVTCTWYVLSIVAPKRGYERLVAVIQLKNVGVIVKDVKYIYVFLLTIMLAAFMGYSIHAYNITANFTLESLQSNNIQLPVWYKVVFTLFRSMMMVATVAIAFQVFSQKGYKLFNWVLLGMAVLFLESMYGRAAYLIFWLTIYIVYLSINNASILTTKSMIFLMLIFGSTLVYSNVFQHIRSVFNLAANSDVVQNSNIGSVEELDVAVKEAVMPTVKSAAPAEGTTASVEKDNDSEVQIVASHIKATTPESESITPLNNSIKSVSKITVPVVKPTVPAKEATASVEKSGRSVPEDTAAVAKPGVPAKEATASVEKSGKPETVDTAPVVNLDAPAKKATMPTRKTSISESKSMTLIAEEDERIKDTGVPIITTPMSEKKLADQEVKSESIAHKAAIDPQQLDRPQLPSSQETNKNSFTSRLRDQIAAFKFTDILFNTRKTISNFKVRPSHWHFNYVFVNQQISSGYNLVPYGKILTVAFLFTIPREIWKDKPKNSLQPIVFSMYGMDYDYFHAPNLFGYMQADFGFLSIIAFVIFILAAIFFTIILLKKVSHRPFLFWLLVGQSVYFFSEVEINYDGYFYYYRALILFTILYWLAILSRECFNYLLRNIRLVTLRHSLY